MESRVSEIERNWNRPDIAIDVEDLRREHADRALSLQRAFERTLIAAPRTMRAPPCAVLWLRVLDRLASGVITALIVGGCGGETPPTRPGPYGDDAHDRVQQALDALVQACRTSNLPAVMARVAYQGDDQARRYKSPWQPSDPLASTMASGLCSVLPATGEPEILELAMHPRTRQTASDWTTVIVKIGETKHFLGFVEADRRLLLGEIQ